MVTRWMQRERESCEPSFAAEAGHSSEEVSEIAER
jgi:hypothetical protein